MRPRILIVIVNYKVAKLAIDSLASLEGELSSLPGIRVVVVDNDSRDGSVEALRMAIATRGWDDWVKLEPSSQNVGFAAGNNLGIRLGWRTLPQSPPDYVLLLNPDTVVCPGSIKVLLKFLENRPEVGIAAGRSEDPDGTPQHCCFRFPNAWNEFASNARLGVIDRLLRKRICRVPISDEAHPIDWASGAFLLIRREVIEQIGLFDENYFLYYEETDLIRRARQGGWTCWHVPQSRIVHLVGFSSGVTVRHRRPDRKPRYWFDSRRRYFLKHHGFFYTAWADLLAILGVALGRAREILLWRPKAYPPRFLWDFVRNSVFVKGNRLQREGRSTWNIVESATAA